MAAMKLKQVLPVSGEWFVMLVDSENSESCHAQRIAAWGLFDEGGVGGDTVVLPLVPDENEAALGLPNSDALGVTDADGSRASYWNGIVAQRRRDAIEEERSGLSEELAARTASELSHDEIVLLKALKNRETFVFVRERLDRLWGKDLIEKVRGGHRVTSFGDRILTKLTQ